MSKSSDKAISNGKTNDEAPQYYDEFPADEIHTMQALTGFKRQNGTDYFLVKWEGYSDAEQTWEPFCNILKPTPEILSQMEILKEKYYEKTRKRKRVRDSSSAGGSRRREGSIRGEKQLVKSKQKDNDQTESNQSVVAHDADDQTEESVAAGVDEDERPLILGRTQKKQVDAALSGSSADRLSKKRRQMIADTSAESHEVPDSSVRGAGEGSFKHKKSTTEAKSSQSKASENSVTTSESALKEDAASSNEKVKILSLVVHKSSLRSKGLKEFDKNPMGLELVDNPNISVQLITEKGMDNAKDIFSLEYVKSKYPMELLNFMLSQVQYYRASV